MHDSIEGLSQRQYPLLLLLLLLFQNESKRQYAAVLAPNVPVNVMQAVESLGIDLATKLMEAGAAEILQAAKKQTADEIMRQKAAKEASKLAAQSEPAIA